MASKQYAAVRSPYSRITNQFWESLNSVKLNSSQNHLTFLIQFWCFRSKLHKKLQDRSPKCMRRRTATNASKSTRGLIKIKNQKIKKKVLDGTADSINFPHGTADPRTNPIPMHHQGGLNQNVLADISTQSWWRRHIRTPRQIRSAYELKLQKMQASRFKRQSIFTSNCWRRKFIWSLSMMDPLILSGKPRSDGLFNEKVEEYFHFGIKRMRDWLQYKWSGYSDTAPTTTAPTTPSAHQAWTHKWSSF